jgi:ankyrin repeat protein
MLIGAAAQRGADVNARDHAGGTALMSAAEAGSVACIVLLLATGADPTLTADGESARALATKHGPGVA